MNKAKKLDVKMLAIWLIALATFVAVVFLVPVARSTVFYIAFAATLVSYGLVAFAYVQSFLHDETLRSKVFGFPIFHASLLAFGVQFVVFLVLAALSSVCPVWLSVIAEGLVLAGTVICLIAVEAARSEVEETEAAVADRTQKMKRLRMQAAAAASAQEDAQVKAEAEKLAQELRFADPVSSAATQEIEQQIETLIMALSEGSSQERLTSIRHALALIRQRNSLAKAGK